VAKDWLDRYLCCLKSSDSSAFWGSGTRVLKSYLKVFGACVRLLPILPSTLINYKLSVLGAHNSQMPPHQGRPLVSGFPGGCSGWSVGKTAPDLPQRPTFPNHVPCDPEKRLKTIELARADFTGIFFFVIVLWICPEAQIPAHAGSMVVACSVTKRTMGWNFSWDSVIDLACANFFSIGELRTKVRERPTTSYITPVPFLENGMKVGFCPQSAVPT